MEMFQSITSNLAKCSPTKKDVKPTKQKSWKGYNKKIIAGFLMEAARLLQENAITKAEYKQLLLNKHWPIGPDGRIKDLPDVKTFIARQKIKENLFGGNKLI